VYDAEHGDWLGVLRVTWLLPDDSATVNHRDSGAGSVVVGGFSCGVGFGLNAARREHWRREAETDPPARVATRDRVEGPRLKSERGLNASEVDSSLEVNAAATRKTTCDDFQADVSRADVEQHGDPERARLVAL